MALSLSKSHLQPETAASLPAWNPYHQDSVVAFRGALLRLRPGERSIAKGFLLIDVHALLEELTTSSSVSFFLAPKARALAAVFAHHGLDLF